MHLFRTLLHLAILSLKGLRRPIFAITVLTIVCITFVSSYTKKKNLEAQLAYYCSISDFDNAEKLLIAGVDPDTPTYHDMKPLIWAAERRNTELANLLIRFGVDTHSGTGKKALSIARQKGDNHTVKAIESQ